METLTVANEIENQLAKKIESIRSVAISLNVKNDSDLQKASVFVKGIQYVTKEVEDYWNPVIEGAHKVHKDLCSKRNLFLKPVEEIKKLINNRIGQYQMEQERKRQEALRKAEAEARAKEEAERKKLLEKAAKAEAEGKAEQAEALMEKAEDVYVAPKPVESTVSRPEGMSIRYAYDAEVIDKAIVPEDYKIVDVSRLSKMATAAKGDFLVPGIRFVKRPIVVQRAS